MPNKVSTCDAIVYEEIKTNQQTDYICWSFSAVQPHQSVMNQSRTRQARHKWHGSEMCNDTVETRWTCYQTDKELYSILDRWSAEPTVEETFTRLTGKGHPFRVFKYTSPSRRTKTVLWFDANIEPLAWGTHAVLLYFLFQLIYKYDDNRAVADAFEIHFLPVANPDGFYLTHVRDYENGWPGSSSHRWWEKDMTDLTDEDYSDCLYRFHSHPFYG